MNTKTIEYIDAQNKKDLIIGTVQIVALEEGAVLVKSENKAACGGCAMSKGCGTKMLSGFLTRNMPAIKIANEFEGKIGERIEVAMFNSAMIKLCAITYLLPLVGMMIGAMVAGSLNANDLLSFIVAVMGLAVGFLVSKVVFSSGVFSSSVELIFLRKLPLFAVVNDDGCKINPEAPLS